MTPQDLHHPLASAARVQALALREQAIDDAWRALAGALRRGWRSLVRMTRVHAA
jgi:hypothetical protein